MCVCSKHDCRRFQNQHAAFARAALHFVLQRPFRVPARHLSCALRFQLPRRSLLSCPSSASQHAVYSPISRCTPEPRLPNITKFRPGSRASVASAGGRYLCAQSLPLRTVAFAWTSPACIGGCPDPSSHCIIALAPPPPPPPPSEASSS